jgi:tetratricopeptide (TPR) repeat protein
MFGNYSLKRFTSRSSCLQIFSLIIFCFAVPTMAADSVQALRKAAEAGDANAQNELALRYENGNGVEQSIAQALKWYQLAAQQGQVDAQYKFGSALTNGDPNALFLMGEAYRTGNGVPKNQEEARKWLEQAAEKGLAEAQYTLGLMYLSGEGVKKDETVAEKWLRMAAAQGYSKISMCGSKPPVRPHHHKKISQPKLIGFKKAELPSRAGSNCFCGKPKTATPNPSLN